LKKSVWQISVEPLCCIQSAKRLSN